MSHNYGESQVTTRGGFLSPSLPILALLMVITSVSTGNCHIASVIGGSGGSDGRSPLTMSHIRLSRGPNVPTVPQTDEPDSASLSRLHFLKPPTYQHKYLQRLSQFHGNERGFGNGNFPLSGTGEYNQGNPVGEEQMPEEQDPTYMPYIGARAFSNIPKFFEHLRANIEALKAMDENNDQPGADGPNWKDDSSERRVSQEEPWFPPSEGNYPWNPLKNHQIRSFHHQPLDRPRHNNYNPSWQYTNLGLGRRR